MTRYNTIRKINDTWGSYEEKRQNTPVGQLEDW